MTTFVLAVGWTTLVAAALLTVVWTVAVWKYRQKGRAVTRRLDDLGPVPRHVRPVRDEQERRR